MLEQTGGKGQIEDKKEEKLEKKEKRMGVEVKVEGEVNRHAGSPTAASVTKHTQIIHSTKKTQ